MILVRNEMFLNMWVRRVGLITLDVLCWILAVLLISLLRFDLQVSIASQEAILVFLVVTLITQIVVGLFTKQYQNRYLIASFEEMVALSILVLGSTVVGAGIAYAFYFDAISGSIVVASPPLAIVLMAGVRSAWRAYKHIIKKKSVVPESVLVIGAGAAGQQLLYQLRRDDQAPYKAVGIIDDATVRKNLHLEGVPVVGKRGDLVRVAREKNISTVIYAINSAPVNVVTEFSDICDAAGLNMLRIPPLGKLFGEKINLDDIKQVDVADLLGRRQVKTNLSEVAGYVTGKVVMVTGAGGSIGSEICRQVNALGPKELVLLDRDESALHAMQLELYGKGLLDTPDMALCSIRDKEALRGIFAQHHPDVIFHTAALKHLPMLEQYPEEGWKTNVLGSKNLIELAMEYEVDTFVNISTDKAADPTSVLGRTKRLAEQIAAYYSHKTKGRFVSVRFGNVLGSRGSMLWTFNKQIEKGGPITITHPDVERYFMTIPEACALVIQAGAIGSPGEVMVLDMGEPVKIMDVANRLIKKSGKDIDIVITGLRPGEKISEILVGQRENDDRPHHPLISHVSVPPIDPAELENYHQYAVETK